MKKLWKFEDLVSSFTYFIITFYNRLYSTQLKIEFLIKWI